MKQLVITLDPSNYNLSLGKKKASVRTFAPQPHLIMGLSMAIKGPSGDWGSAAQLLRAAGAAVLLPSAVTIQWPTYTSFATGQRRRSLYVCACAISQRIIPLLWFSPGFINFVVHTAALGVVLGVGEHSAIPILRFTPCRRCDCSFTSLSVHTGQAPAGKHLPLWQPHLPTSLVTPFLLLDNPLPTSR